MNVAASEPAENPPSHAETVAPKPTHSRLRAVLFMIVGLAAAFASEQAIGRYYMHFTLPEELSVKAANAQNLSQADQKEISAAILIMNTKNSALSFGIFGGLLGVVFGVFLAISFKPSRLVLGLLFGIIFGTIGGGAAGYLAVSAYEYSFANNLEFKGAVAHCTAFTVIGIGLGITFALTLGRVGSLPGYLLAGALAGFLGALIFHPAVAYFMPIANVESVIPLETNTRILWVLIPGALFGLFLGGRPLPAKTDAAPA